MRRPWASEPPPKRGRLWIGLLAVFALAILTWGLNQEGGFSGGGRPGQADPAELPAVAAADLPPQVARTLAQIRAGRPPRHGREPVVFANQGGLLPAEPPGYYHEYAVGAGGQQGGQQRGAGSLVVGAAGDLYWTHDHDRTFERITP